MDQIARSYNSDIVETRDGILQFRKRANNFALVPPPVPRDGIDGLII
jgi:hypothetical protein